MVSGALVAAVVIGLASVAFACSSKFLGTLKVSGAGGAATAVGSNGPGMVYCNGFPTGNLRVTHGQTATLTLEVQSNTGACATLSAQAHQVGGPRGVMFQQTHAFTNGGGPGPWLLDPAPTGDCMWAQETKTVVRSTNGGTQTYTVNAKSVGMFTLNTAGDLGAGTIVVSITANAFTNASLEAGSICITDGTGTVSAMEAPLVFV